MLEYSVLAVAVRLAVPELSEEIPMLAIDGLESPSLLHYPTCHVQRVSERVISTAFCSEMAIVHDSA
jgi:hypothetical protein